MDAAGQSSGSGASSSGHGNTAIAGPEPADTVSAWEAQAEAYRQYWEAKKAAGLLGTTAVPPAASDASRPPAQTIMEDTPHEEATSGGAAAATGNEGQVPSADVSMDNM